MAPPDEVDWDDEEVLNRARLYRDRRDFVIQDGDSGMPANSTPAVVAVRLTPLEKSWIQLRGCLLQSV